MTKIMTHVVAGYPTFRESLKFAETLALSGASILEVQVPFSEPVADGPVIVEACHTALRNGFKTSDIFEFCKKTSAHGVPVVVMTYANPLVHMGIDTFCRRLKKSGAVGLIVPDLPFDSEEGEALRKTAKKHDIDLIQVVSPAMDGGRLSKIIAVSENLIYCTSKRGTTGGEGGISKDLRRLVSDIRKSSNISIAVGFGISTKQDVQDIQKIADVAVVGSALIRKFQEFSGARRYGEIRRFFETL